MKQAVVFLRGVKAGVLTEDENGYTFAYDADYLASEHLCHILYTYTISQAHRCGVGMAGNVDIK